MRVWIKRIGIGIVIPVVCLLLVSILLYVPAIQNKVAGKALAYVSASTGWDIGFERIQLSFPFDLSVRNSFIKGTNHDTLVYLGKLTVDVRLKPLLKGQLSVKQFHLESLDLNTGNLLTGIVVRGTVGKACLRADSVNLSFDRIDLDKLIFQNADIDLFLCDTTASDTADSATNLYLGLKKVELRNTAFTLRMPCDSIYMNMQVEEAVLADGFIDLGVERYGASDFFAKINEFSYAKSSQIPPAEEFERTFTDITLMSDSLYYDSENTFFVSLKECSAKERSGLVVQSMTAQIISDSMRMEIPSFQLTTDASTLQLQAVIPYSFLQDTFSLSAKAVIHKRDVLLLAGNTPALQTYYPDTAFIVEAFAQGNRAAMTLQRLNAELPGAFQICLSGAVNSFDNVRLRSGRVDYEINTQALGFVAGLFPSILQPDYQIPDSMCLTGHLTVDKEVYAAEMTGMESAGSILLSGNYDVLTKNYEAFLTIDDLEPVHFMPNDSIMRLTAMFRAKGQGTDPYLPSTQAELEGKISDIRYGNTSFSDIAFSGSLKNNQLQAELESKYPFAKGRISVDATVKKDTVKGLLIADVDSLDFYRAQLTESPISTSFQLFSEFETDLATKHTFDVTLGNWNLSLENRTVQPKMLTLAFRSDIDTTHATFYAGDMNLLLTGNTDLQTLTKQMTQLSKEASVQLARDSTVDMQALRRYFPDISLHISADRNNPVYQFLQDYNMFFEHFRLDATLSPEAGLNMNSTLLALVKDTLKIDTIRMNVWQDTTGICYGVDVAKNRFRSQEPFRLNVNGYVRPYEADLFVSFVNGRGEKGLYLGVNAEKAPNGYDFHFYPENPVIAFLPFTINDNNYFHFENRDEMEADIYLKGDNYTSIRIHSDHHDDNADELMVELAQFNLAEVSRKFAILPSLSGMMDMSFRYVPEDNSFFIVADGNIDDFHYEGGHVGELLLNATYIPVAEGAHQIDFHAFHDMAEIMALSALYKEGRNGNKIDGFASVNRLPLSMFNAMIPDQTVRMDGFLNGNFDIAGTDDKPELSGSMRLENVSAYVIPAVTTLHFDDQPVKVTKNKLTLDKFKIYTLKENPFIIEGSIDATNTDRPVADLRMTATNMPLIDTRKTPESLIYGRLFVNFNSTLTGPLQSMRMRGNMRVLGNSNFTYVMMDTPMEVQDKFENLVTFTYFADTLPRRMSGAGSFNLMSGVRGTAAVTGTDILLTVNIDPVVRFRVDLNAEQSNYLEMRGGGDLSLQYTTQGDMRLNGRYALSDGAIRYTIPVIPLTDFSIKNGSYVDWSGDPMNPFLNISAYTRVRSSVGLDAQSRKVDFNAGIQLRDYLDDVSVQFLLEAPTDAVMQNQLTAMNAEERSKQAISLLVTGVYLANEGTGADNMDVGAALNSLLQREIKNMVGSLLGDVPFSFDVNTYDGTKGMGRRVDYLGRFYKDFLNERLTTTVGLRYTTNDPVYKNAFLLDDISFGYRLDADGSRTVHLFRSQDYENLFEGEIGKIGVRYTVQKKLKRLPDLFLLRKKDAFIIKKEEDDEK